MHLKFVQLIHKAIQWFDLINENEEIILEKSLIAEEKLSIIFRSIF